MTNYRVCVKCDTTFRTRSMIDRETKCETCRPPKGNKYAGVSKRNTQLLKEWEDMQQRVLLLEAALEASYDAFSAEMDMRVQEYAKQLEESMEKHIERIVKTRIAKVNTRVLKLTDDVQSLQSSSARNEALHGNAEIQGYRGLAYKTVVRERREAMLEVLSFFGDLSAYEIKGALIQKFGLKHPLPQGNQTLYADMKALEKQGKIVRLPAIKGEKVRWKINESKRRTR